MHIELGNTLTEFVSAFENGIRFDKVVENSSLSLRQSLKLGSLSGNSLRLTLSGNLALCEAFLAYKYLRVTKDDHVVFVGVLQTYNKKTETPTQSEYTANYKDMAEDWKNAVFCPDTYQAFHNGDSNSYDIGSVIDPPSVISLLEKQRDDLYKQYTTIGSDYGFSQLLYEKYVEVGNTIEDVRNGLGSGEYGWEWSCVESDGYKILDMSNPSKSLVHKLISFLPDSQYISISSPFSRLTPVKAFKADAKDKTLDTILKVCSQNCIALTLEGLTVTLHDLFRQSGTAKTVAKIERQATLSDKPYIDLSQPDIRWCSKVEEVSYDGAFLGFGKYLFEGESTEVFEPNSYYPSNNQHLWSIPFQPTIPANSELFRTAITNKKTSVYKRGWVGGTYATDAYPEIVDFKSHGDKCLVRLRNRYANAKYKEWEVKVSGVATFVGYNSVVTSVLTNGKEETCKYIYSADDARNYDAVRLWSKSSDARYYSFYADDELSLGDLVSLTGVSDEALIIISKTDNLDAFGGYSYTASKVIDSKQVSFDEFYQAIPLDMPRVGDSLKIYASRTEVYCSADGTPQDTTPILVTIDAMSEPTLFIGGQAVPLTRVTKMDGDDEILLDTWEARISADLGGNGSIVLTASLDDSTVDLTITKMLATDGGVTIEYALSDTNTFYPADGYLTLSDDMVLRYNDIDLVYEIYEGSQIQQIGTYVWMRTRNADGSFTYACQTGKGEDARVFTIASNVTSVLRDDRSSLSNSIVFTLTYQGYRSISLPTLTVNGVPVSVTWDSAGKIGKAIVSAPRKQATRLVAVMSEPSQSLSTTLELEVLDRTSANEYLGILSSAPTEDKYLNGDSYVSRTSEGELVIMVYDDGWKSLAESSLSNAEKSRICGVCQKDVLDNVEVGTVSSSEYGYFRNIIAEVVSADYIKAMEGVFDSITIKGNSYFYGSFDCPTIQSMPNSEGTVITRSIPNWNGTNEDGRQFDAMVSLYSEMGFIEDRYYDISVSSNSNIKYVVYKTSVSGKTTYYDYNFLDSSFSKLAHISRAVTKIFSTPTIMHSTEGLTSAFTLSISYGFGDILKLKGLQSGSVGLQENQIYYTTINGHKVLCLV